MFSALVRAESGGSQGARSPAGAIGLTQLMPATARGLGVDPNDPAQNLAGGAKYLRQQLNTFGDMRKALAAYNAGPGAVSKYGGVPPYAETQAYVNKIMAAQPHGFQTDSLSSAGVVPGGSRSRLVAPPPPPPPQPAVDFRRLFTGADSTLPLLQGAGRAGGSSLPLLQQAGLGEAKPFGGSWAPTPAQKLPSLQQALTAGRDWQDRGFPEAKPTPWQGPLPAGARLPARDILGSSFKLIGSPHQGTHTLGNWESDNAVDLGVPEGTPIYAAFDGTIGNQFGPLDSSNPRMAGLRLHLLGQGDELYYAHLSRFAPGVKPGAAVKAGQVIGYSGVANGVPHLHLGDRTGSVIGGYLHPQQLAQDAQHEPTFTQPVWRGERPKYANPVWRGEQPTYRNLG